MTLQLIPILAPCIAFVVVFLWASTWEGMINEWVRNLTDHWPPYFKKPIYDCPICMAPWWGSAILVVYGLAMDFWLPWFEWVLTVFAAGGINTLLAYIISSDKEEVKALKDDN